MASGKSLFLRNAIINQNLGLSSSYTAPATVFIALSQSDWDASLTGTTLSLTEPTNGYLRVEVNNDSSTWITGASDSRTNNITIEFENPTGSWGTIRSFYIVDSLTGGNILYGGDLLADKEITTGDIATFGPGQLSVKEL